MTLVFERADLHGQAGLHALIVGVSAYDHLLDGMGTPASNNLGLRQLSSSALSAWKMFEWLLRRQDKLPVPLATVRLLLSPSQVEEFNEPELGNAVERCCRENFGRAAEEWRTDASSNSDNITMFYFAGHGLQTTGTGAVLLLDDFADPSASDMLSNAVYSVNLRAAMNPCSERPNMAQTQFYFIDSCRVSPGTFTNRSVIPPDVLDISQALMSEAKARSEMFATLPATVAYAKPGYQTVFSQALLKGLEGMAGKAVGNNVQVFWLVTDRSLGRVLSYFSTQNQNLGLLQQFLVSSNASEINIDRLDGAPMVSTTLDTLGQESQFSKVEVEDGNGTIPWMVDPTQAAPPYKNHLPAGDYDVHVTMNNGNGNFTLSGSIEPLRGTFIVDSNMGNP